MAKKKIVIDSIYVYDGANKTVLDLFYCPSHGGNLPFDVISDYYQSGLKAGQWVDVECRSPK